MYLTSLITYNKYKIQQNPHSRDTQHESISTSGIEWKCVQKTIVVGILVHKIFTPSISRTKAIDAKCTYILVYII